jgi:hypothetical protein
MIQALTHPLAVSEERPPPSRGPFLALHHESAAPPAALAIITFPQDRALLQTRAGADLFACVSGSTMNFLVIEAEAEMPPLIRPVGVIAYVFRTA